MHWQLSDLLARYQGASPNSAARPRLCAPSPLFARYKQNCQCRVARTTGFGFVMRQEAALPRVHDAPQLGRAQHNAVRVTRSACGQSRWRDNRVA